MVGAGREKGAQSFHRPPPRSSSASLRAVRWRQSCTHKGFPCLTLLLISVSVACSSSVTPSCEVLLPPPLSHTKGREISLIGHRAGLGPGLLSLSFRVLYPPHVTPPTQELCDHYFLLVWTPKREGTEWVSDFCWVAQQEGLCGQSAPWWPSR